MRWVGGWNSRGGVGGGGGGNSKGVRWTDGRLTISSGEKRHFT